MHNNVKIFNNLQEFWDYFEFCPICQQNNRHIYQIGFLPPYVAKETFTKQSEILHIAAVFSINQHAYSGTLQLNCQNNTFNFSLKEFIFLTNAKFKNILSCYLKADCFHCNCSYIHGLIQLNLLTQTISNFDIVREVVHLLDYEDKFNIQLKFKDNEMQISQYTSLNIGENNQPLLVDDNQVMTLPLVPLDFTNIPKVISRLKTMMLLF
jgi:hypothetical protein